MDIGEARIRVAVRPTAEEVEGAAQVWAAASARRDGVPEASWQEKELGIRRRLELPAATLILAERGGEVDAFAVLATGSDGPELFYLAVHPRAWGAGLATALLTVVVDWGWQSGHGQLRLWVIDDNDRARSVYERAGWVATTQLQRTTEKSRVERLYLRDVVASG